MNELVTALRHPDLTDFWRIVRRILTLKRFRRALRNRLQVKRALVRLAQFPRHADAPRHSLPSELVISLTSYPARFDALHWTIMSLLEQTVRPDKILLWIAKGDIDRLPDTVRALENDIFAVKTCDDLRNFKKIVPTLAAYPDAFVLICDDDTYYPEDWLKTLVDAFDPAHPTVVCTRAHRLAYLPDGRIAPYRAWERNVADVAMANPGTDILPTGNGGVLYPPGSLPPQTTDLELIRRLSETSDDVWLYFMWRQAGWIAKRVPGERRRFTEWPDTQGSSLRMFHRGGKKDEHIQDMAEYFGVP